jgi:hypothetical protein
MKTTERARHRESIDTEHRFPNCIGFSNEIAILNRMEYASLRYLSHCEVLAVKFKRLLKTCHVELQQGQEQFLIVPKRVTIYRSLKLAISDWLSRAGRKSAIPHRLSLHHIRNPDETPVAK